MQFLIQKLKITLIRRGGENMEEKWTPIQKLAAEIIKAVRRYEKRTLPKRIKEAIKNKMDKNPSTIPF